ncbi:unnamed protein product, partial [Iphiclides podalirius]
MGNEQSIEKECRKRQAHVEEVLERQRKLYEEKCKILLQQAHSAQQTRVAIAEEVSADNSSNQRLNTLYPNLHPSPAPQPCSSTTNVRNSPSSFAANNNCIPNNVVSTSAINPNLQSASGLTTRLTPSPSAPPEPFGPNKQKDRTKKGKRPRPNKNNKLSVGREFDCVTCGRKLGLNIYQCGNGHSSCRECKMARRVCGAPNCGGAITDMRNRAVEALVADVMLANRTSALSIGNSEAEVATGATGANETPSIFDRECKLECPNKYDGCQLSLSSKEINKHLSECPFSELACPLASIFGRCSWRGKINQLVSHFIDVHPEHRQANVDTELKILDVKYNNRIVYLVAIGNFNFLAGGRSKSQNKAKTAYNVIHMDLNRWSPPCSL